MGNSAQPLPSKSPSDDSKENNNLMVLPKLQPNTSSNLAASGFRNRIATLKFTADEVEEFLHIVDELNEMPTDDNAQLLAQTKKLAVHHGIIDGDYQYTKEENLLDDITSNFTYMKQLGFGASCRVLLVEEHKTNTKYALKELIVNDEYNPMLFKKEIKLLSTLDHPNILKYHESYIDPHNFYIATHYCYGGDLFQRLQQFHKFTEHDAAQIMHTIIDAVAYMHDKGKM